MKSLLALLTVFAVACGGNSGGGITSSSQSATLPPEGRIAFVVDYVGRDADTDIYTINPDGRGLRRLTENSYLNRNPTWSSDGKRIAFTSNRTGYFSNLFVMQADGSNETNVTKNDDTDHRVIGWASHDKLVIDEGTGNTYSLKLLDPSNPKASTPLTERGRLARSETVSPEGKMLAFDDIRTVQLVQLDPPGQALRLMPSNERVSNEEPSWSPDGKRLAFISDRDGRDEVYVMNEDGSGQTKLSSGTQPATSPQWSPDGTRIAFLRDTKKPGDFRSATQLYVINADGSGEKAIASQTCDGQHGFTWSPDGQRLAFVRGCDADSRTELTQLFVINADGSGEKRIATEIKRAISDPAWSPAGR